MHPRQAPETFLCRHSARINNYSAVFDVLTVRRSTLKVAGESFVMIALFAAIWQ